MPLCHDNVFYLLLLPGLWRTSAEQIFESILVQRLHMALCPHYHVSHPPTELSNNAYRCTYILSICHFGASFADQFLECPEKHAKKTVLIFLSSQKKIWACMALMSSIFPFPPFQSFPSSSLLLLSSLHLLSFFFWP